MDHTPLFPVQHQQHNTNTQRVASEIDVYADKAEALSDTDTMVRFAVTCVRALLPFLCIDNARNGEADHEVRVGERHRFVGVDVAV